MKQNVDDYFTMLGKVFEWTCWEDSHHPLSTAIGFDFDTEKFYKKFEPCPDTAMQACKRYDNEFGTDYYEKLMYGLKNGLEHEIGIS